MTAIEVVAWLTADKAFGQECYSRKQIAQLIAKQHQQIERLKCCGNCEHWQYAWHSNGLDKRCRIKILKQPDRESKCNEWQGV